MLAGTRTVSPGSGMPRKHTIDAPAEIPSSRSDGATTDPPGGMQAEPAAAAAAPAAADDAGLGLVRLVRPVRDDQGAGARGPGYGRGVLRITRSRGLLTGLLLVLLGIWGAIVPFDGPYFGYGLGHAGAWYFTMGRLWLDILPGIAVLLGGAVLAASRNRVVAWLAAWVAVVGGIWFVVGGQISRLWTAGGASAAGVATGAVGHQVAQYMGYYLGLGVVISVLAALAAGRLAVRGVRDARVASAERIR